MSHTPGPWMVHQKTKNVFGNYEYVGRVDSSEANARLIAEAPAMYAFLKQLTLNCDEKEPQSFNCEKLIALEILARIEGRK